MASQVKINLVALSGNVPLPERSIILHPDFHTIQVGRASKSPSKGLQAALDNAWFDSPVMSRNHAEIFMDSDSIYVKDIGSMHGTFINDTQLSPDEPSQLNNGDKLVLGAEVKRNLDTFPACVFQVNFKVFPFPSTNSYAFPESDGEDDEISVADTDHIEEPSSEDGVSIIESPPHKVSQAIDAIDLTQDDIPTHLPRPIAAFHSVGPSHVEKDVIETLVAHATTENNRGLKTASMPIFSEGPSILIESDDEDAHFSSDSDSQPDEIEYDEGASVSDGEQYMLEDSVNSEDDEGAEALGEMYGDEESELGLEDVGAAGISALFDEDLIDDDSQSMPWNDVRSEVGEVGLADRSKVSSENVANEDSAKTPKHVTFPSFGSRPLQEAASSFAQPKEYQRTFGKFGVPSTSASARQPSPSDAAMVKTVKPSATTFSQPSSQSLGDKTGKHAFFAAREDNKAKLQASENLRIAPWSQDLLEMQQQKINLEHKAPEEKAKLPGASAMFTHSFATLPYLEDPAQGPRAARTPSPEFDMTSAVTFNESKASMAASSKHVAGRSALRINDIIEAAAGDRSGSNLKRKADDISKTIENEVRVWASSSAAPDTAPGTSAAAPAQEQSTTSPASISLEHRPAKRLRKIVESVGYVALGGATLFGALVLSAPDFL